MPSKQEEGAGEGAVPPAGELGGVEGLPVGDPLEPPVGELDGTPLEDGLAGEVVPGPTDALVPGCVD